MRTNLLWLILLVAGLAVYSAAPGAPGPKALYWMDHEGAVNHDVEESFNQVIAGGRTGRGVTRVEMEFYQ